jgi:hypothetical protein
MGEVNAVCNNRQKKYDAKFLRLFSPHMASFYVFFTCGCYLATTRATADWHAPTRAYSYSGHYEGPAPHTQV